MSHPVESEPVQYARVDGGWLLWPPDRQRPPLEWCEPGALPGSAATRAGGFGRGETVCFEAGGRTLILRRYRRGGMAQRLGDRYLRLGLRRSRAWRELALLTRMHALGLPVPRPVAARVEPVAAASPFCRATLLTEYLPGTRTLTQALRGGGIARTTWERIGGVLARFHAAGIDHADLNAHNILVGDNDALYLIDFDRGRLRARRDHWCRRNLDRLRRSLDKLAARDGEFAFAEPDWEALERGYREARSAGPIDSDSAST